jgi:quercetin dioxygenase-like cupin family protein
MPHDIVWKAPPVSPGPETAVTYGDPSKPGVYVMRVRFPAGFKLMPHFHPDEWRTGVVLSGNYYFALGEQWDESKLTPYPAGTFFSEPKGTPHFVWEGWRGDRPVHRHGPYGDYPDPAKAMTVCIRT